MDYKVYFIDLEDYPPIILNFIFVIEDIAITSKIKVILIYIASYMGLNNLMLMMQGTYHLIQIITMK